MKLVLHDRKIRIDFDGSVIGTGKWAEGTAVGVNRKKKGQLWCSMCCIVPATSMIPIGPR